MNKANVKRASQMAKTINKLQNRQMSNQIKTAIIYQMQQTSKQYTLQLRSKDKDTYSIIACALKNDTKAVIGGILLSPEGDIQKVVNAPDKFNRTPIMYASYHKNRLLCEFLLINGADPTIIDYKNKSILHHCAANNSGKFIKFVNSMISNFTRKKPLADAYETDILKCIDGSEITSISSTAKIDESDSTWEATIQKKILAAPLNFKEDQNISIPSVNPNFIDKQDKYGRTALHIAAHYGDYETVKALVHAGAMKNIQCNIGLLPIDVSESDVIKALLSDKPKKIIKPYQIKDTNKPTMISPLKEIENMNNIESIQEAIQTGNDDAFSKLIQHSKKLANTDSNGYNILHLIALHRRYKMLETLSQYLAKDRMVLLSLYKERSNNDLTALHICSNSNYVEMAELILSVLKNRITSKDYELIEYIDFICCKKETALIKACKNNCYDTIELLLKNNANMYKTDALKRTALHYASLNKNIKAIKEMILLDCEENALRKIKDYKGKTAEDLFNDKTTSIFMHWWDLCSDDRYNTLVVKMLKEGYDVNSQTPIKRNSGLMFAIKSNAFKNIATLLSFNADVYIMNQQGSTPISLAKGKKLQLLFQKYIPPSSPKSKEPIKCDPLKDYIKNEDMRKAIIAADTNSDGFIDNEELRCLCTVLEIDKKLLFDSIACSKSNHFGRISIKELFEWADK